jgi:uncharacterized repeat protein (TIGR01451 family)
MNRIHERSSKLRVARFATVALTLLFIATLFVPTLSAQIVAPAGSVIGNQATATYTDANNVSRQAFSNLVQTSVTQIYKGTLNQSQSKYATPGTQVLFPHTYQNTGNGPDTVTFTYPTVGSDLTNVHVYIDANGDGIPDNTTDLNNTAIPVAASAYVKVVVVATLSSGAVKTDPAANFQLSLNAASGGSGTVTGNPNTDTVVYSSNGVINVTKSMVPVSGQNGLYTVTLTYTNTGNATATTVAMIDDLVAQGTNFTYCKGSTVLTCSSGTGSATWNGTGFTDASGGPTGLTWTVTTPTGGMTATVASVAPGVTGTVTYNLLAATPSTYPATFTNYAKYQYVDGGGNTIPSGSTYINTNTISLGFNGYAGVKFTAATAMLPATAVTYTAGSGTAPAVNTTPDTDLITAPTVYSAGTTIFWSQTITNKGQVTDTFNLTLDSAGAGTALDPTIANPFPSGTTFQLYRSDGKTPLTDSNGDGIVDSGPLAANGTTVIVVAATVPANFTVTSSTTYAVNVIATSTNATASNFATPGLQDGIQDEVTITSTKNAGVDVAANAADTIGNGTGVSGEAAGPYTGNPGAVIAIPFWIFNNGTSTAPDAYNLSFRYSTTDIGTLSTPLTPFTSTQAGTTPPASGTIPAWTVQIAPNTGASCSTYGAPVTASSVIAQGGNAEYCLVMQVPAGYAQGTYYFAVQAQSSGTGGIDQMAVKATVNSYASVSISPNNQGTIYAGGTVSYKHVITNGGNVTETVNFTTPTNTNSGGWTVAIFAADGTGTLNTLATPVVPGTTTVSLNPAASAIYYLVVQAPAGANPGDVDVTGWGITVTGNNSTAIAITDTTTVVSGQVKLVKSLWVDKPCTHGTPTFITTSGSTVTSGQCIMYQIVATNTGTTNATALTIADGAPPYTTYLNAYTPTAANTCSLTNPATPALTGTSPISYTFTGSMTPGCTATVTFEVQLN